MMPAAFGAVQFIETVQALDSSGPEVKNVSNSRISYPFLINVFKLVYFNLIIFI